MVLTKRRDAAAIIAKAHGYTPDYVRKVIRGERKNDEVKASYTQLIKQDKKLLKSLSK